MDELRAKIRHGMLACEAQTMAELIQHAHLSATDRATIQSHATQMIQGVRDADDPGIMQNFLIEYGLSTREGVALMCLAEALLRVPDTETIDALIDDKISPSDWGSHLGRSSSSLVNASTWALLLTGKVLADAEPGLVGSLRGAVKRLGEPVIRTAVAQAMRELGQQFVLGETMALAQANAQPLRERGYTFSYDMLGEAARTEADARHYHLAYSDAITAVGGGTPGESVADRPGMSVKLSALHPRYEFAQRDLVMTELVARLRSLAMLAKSAGIGLNVDAEEADRLDLSLDIMYAVLSEPALADWDGFGIVVQAYGKRARHVIDWVYETAGQLDRRLMVRLVKGAYWDAEIKRAQVLGLSGYPVFTRKINTDVSYIACARQLLGMTDRLYPQFATHNAHTMAAILHMAGDTSDFEFQRLHGMGDVLHDQVLVQHGTRCRIYAPVGAHEDLLAYLVRRLLENGANSSFVNQIVDETIDPQEIARDPFAQVEELLTYEHADVKNPNIPLPSQLYGASRVNAKGWDITDPVEVDSIMAGRDQYRTHRWSGQPLVESQHSRDVHSVINPARPSDCVGDVAQANPEDVEAALSLAVTSGESWQKISGNERARLLRCIADSYEANAFELFALLARESGKTLPDAVGEVREAVDFARYYANQAEELDGGLARGTIVCISPWNFPLAIFSGQIFGALAAGNVVIAKPAEQTPLIAIRAVQLMHEAGVAPGVVQVLPGEGATVGAALTADARVNGVCFTGSTYTAQLINRSMAHHLSPDAALIAETGGLNAMIVDSTALPEQAVRDIVASAFQSAGQRCSALRVLYLQSDVADRVLTMLYGAMDELVAGDPWELTTDTGPVIDTDAQRSINSYIQFADDDGRLLKQVSVPDDGTFVAPAVIKVDGIEALDEEIFGPVLHVALFEADDIDTVVNTINASGYGLTFGLHTRIDDRVQHIVDRVTAGNIYVNRNQIGAVVGTQPFGGEGLSGTGPKAGGPHYVPRLQTRGQALRGQFSGDQVSTSSVQGAIGTIADTWSPDAILYNPHGDLHPNNPFFLQPRDLPGPTGESNRLTFVPRGIVLCLGPDPDALREQVRQATGAGNAVVAIASQAHAAVTGTGVENRPVIALNGQIHPGDLEYIDGLAAVACSADPQTLTQIRIALAARDGDLIPLITSNDVAERYVLERHLCVDTTAAGGNASLLAAADETVLSN